MMGDQSASQSTEILAAGAIADISNVIETRLREKHLKEIIDEKDKLLRSARPGDSDVTRALRRRKLEAVEELWAEIMQNLELELPKALDLLFEDLKREYEQPSSRRRNSITPLTPPTTSRGLPILTNQAATFRERSLTPQELYVGDVETSMTEAGSPRPPQSPNKRTLDSTELASPCNTKKKAKRTPHSAQKIPENDTTPNRTIYVRDCLLNKGECIFKYGDHTGYYVLRCNYNKCKERLKIEGGPIFFQSHPFEDGVAMEHFGGEGHNIRTEQEVFRKFARRVSDANKEHNVEKTMSPRRDGERSVPISPPPINNRDKGKQPTQSLLSLFDRRKPANERPSTSGASAAEASTSSLSKQQVGEELTHPDSSYRPSSLFSASLSVPTHADSDEEEMEATQESLFVRQEDDYDEIFKDDIAATKNPEEYRRVGLGLRGQKAYPDYKEKPPNDEEFQ
ncbi:hypothetical protein F5Y16DRAFT_381820 [Xylariaceae sp. FL0255]|nr:hypothetical protein F5Y16DRAFT_381820 [Xylariaceae sp. FL0255]